jgi:pyridoxamine 5'-phosphate oxidase family protein
LAAARARGKPGRLGRDDAQLALEVAAGPPRATWRSDSTRDESNEQMIELTAAQVDYLSSQRLGRLATAGADGKPHVVPTSFRYNRDLGAIDIGGLHVATTKKYRDVQANPWAAIVVDDLVSTDPWTPRMLEIRGRAEAVASGGADLGAGFGDAFIRLSPEKVNSFGIE